MSREAQQEEERFYLDKFLDASSFQPEKIERGADPPDFILTASGRSIAVELTEFHSRTSENVGDPRRAIEVERGGLFRRIEEKRAAHPELNTINCRLAFLGLCTPRRDKHGQFADQVVRFVLSKVAIVTAERQSYWCFDAYPLLSEYLVGIDIEDLGCHVPWDWYNADWVGVTEEKLCATISPKLKIARPSNILENWLLVVSGSQLSQSMGDPDVGLFQAFGTLNERLQDGPYDKVFIFSYWPRRVFGWDRHEGWCEVSSRHRSIKYGIELSEGDEGE